MKLELNVEQKREFIKEKIQNSGNKFLSVEFVKKDGTKRNMNIQHGALFNNLVGDEASDSAKKAVETRKKNHPELLAVWDVQKSAIRSINLDTVYKMTVAGDVYEF